MQDLGIQNLWLFIIAVWAFVASPGPGVFYIITNTVRGGRPAGLAAVLGICTGNLMHAVAATVGIGALIAASSTTFQALKWVGAAYLCYIGYKMIIDHGTANALQASGEPVQVRRVFKRGFLTVALDPTVAVFFLAFLPQFVHAQATHPTLGFASLGLLLILNALPILLGYMLLSSWLSKRVGDVQRILLWLEHGAGVLMIAFGVKLALSAM
jgi:threonine/homoserine/homoserine lactone efflux protein